MNVAMRSTLCAIALSLAVCVVADVPVFDAFTQSDFEATKKLVHKLIDDNKEKGLTTFNAGYLRLTFHDCWGGCDGCIDFTNGANAGLDKYMTPLLKLWAAGKLGDKTLQQKMSFADLIAVAGIVGVEYATSFQKGCEDGSCAPNVTYKVGRVDCADRANPPINKLFPFPGPHHNNAPKLGAEFGLTVDEFVAILGAHTIGKCSQKNAAFEGKWTEDNTVFNNNYFKMMLNGSLDWKQKNNSIGHMFWAPNIPTILSLGVDMNLAHKTDVPAQAMGVSNCNVFKPLGNKPVCPSSDTKNVVEAFAKDNKLFYTVFGRALIKVISNTKGIELYNIGQPSPPGRNVIPNNVQPGIASDNSTQSTLATMAMTTTPTIMSVATAPDTTTQPVPKPVKPIKKPRPAVVSPFFPSGTVLNLGRKRRSLDLQQEHQIEKRAYKPPPPTYTPKNVEVTYTQTETSSTSTASTSTSTSTASPIGGVQGPGFVEGSVLLLPTDTPQRKKRAAEEAGPLFIRKRSDNFDEETHNIAKRAAAYKPPPPTYTPKNVEVTYTQTETSSTSTASTSTSTSTSSPIGGVQGPGFAEGSVLLLPTDTPQRKKRAVEMDQEQAVQRMFSELEEEHAVHKRSSEDEDSHKMERRAIKHVKVPTSAAPTYTPMNKVVTYTPEYNPTTATADNKVTYTPPQTYTDKNKATNYYPPEPTANTKITYTPAYPEDNKVTSYRETTATQENKVTYTPAYPDNSRVTKYQETTEREVTYTPAYPQNNKATSYKKTTEREVTYTPAYPENNRVTSYKETTEKEVTYTPAYPENNKVTSYKETTATEENKVTYTPMEVTYTPKYH